MYGPVTTDGFLATHPEGGEQLAIAFNTEFLDEPTTERIMDNDPALKLLGRSVIAQVGGDIYAQGKPVVDSTPNNSRNSRLFVPIGLATHAPIAGALSEDLNYLSSQTEPGLAVEWKNSSLSIGRFADMTHLNKLDKDEVEQALDDKLIGFDPEAPDDEEDKPYRINDDGSVEIKLSQLEFIIDEDHLIGSPDKRNGSIERRLDLLKQGRTGVRRNTDTISKESSALLPEFLLGGIVFSPGPYYWKIRTEVADGVRQLPGGALFDGDRVAGVGKHLLAYDRNRQVEFVVQKDKGVAYDDTWVTVDMYWSSQVASPQLPIFNWDRLSPEEREHRHSNGMSPLEALDCTSRTNREALLDIARKPDVASLVLSRKGARTVHGGESLQFNAKNTERELRRTPDGTPDNLAHIQPLIDALGSAGDRTNVVVADTLRLEDLNAWVGSGDARAILFNKEASDTLTAMTLEQHAVKLPFL